MSILGTANFYCAPGALRLGLCDRFLWSIALYLTALALGLNAPALAEAEAGEKPPAYIGIFLSSRTDECFDRGDVPAIKRLAMSEQDRINRQGGIAGRRVRLEFLDDNNDAKQAIAHLRTAIADPNTLALIGLSSERAKAAFDAVGPDIKGSQIPLLSNISDNKIFADYPNVFSMQASQDDERIPILAQFIKQNNMSRPAFVGLEGSLFSATLGDGLKRALGDAGLAADHRLRRIGGKQIDPAAVAAMIEDLKQKSPDVVFLSVADSDRPASLLRTASVLDALIAAKVTPALFVSGRIDSIRPEIANAYPGDIYQLTFDRLPDVYRDRLRKRISLEKPEEWVFEGRKVPEAPGWKTGECTARPSDAAPDVLGDANIWAIGVGARFADMVALIAAAAGAAEPNAGIPALRAGILAELDDAFAAGRGAFQGRFENWSFRRSTRAAARTPFIVRRPHGLGRTQLAPVQYVRLRNDALRPVGTLYLDIDLIRASRVDEGEKAFFAEFYLSMRDEGTGASIEQLDFSNAFIDPETNDRQTTVHVLNNGGKSDSYPGDMKIYHVSGKFIFQPKLASYPFDTQRFSIDIRPKFGDAPFIIQPPPESLRDRAVRTDGWDQKEFYVGYEEDFVPTIDAKTHERAVVPFYKANFVWLMKRETTDYFLRVVMPLAFILIVAYLSIFIPRSHFEAIVTIQVTALLSSVALYLSLQKMDSNSITLSDRMFLFSYMTVSLMIGVSIMRVNHYLAALTWVRTALGAAHVLGVPVLALLMALYLYRESLSIS